MQKYLKLWMNGQCGQSHLRSQNLDMVLDLKFKPQKMLGLKNSKKTLLKQCPTSEQNPCTCKSAMRRHSGRKNKCFHKKPTFET